jgi:hypothetical protein
MNLEVDKEIDSYKVKFE